MISILFHEEESTLRGMLYSSSDCFLFPVPQGLIPEGHLPLPLLLAVVAVIVVLGMVLTCGSLSIGKKHLFLITL